MPDEDWGEKEKLPDGTYLRYYFATQRWYLYDKDGLVMTSSPDKDNVLKWKDRK